MDRKNLGILLTALILILAVFLGVELVGANRTEEQAPVAPIQDVQTPHTAGPTEDAAPPESAVGTDADPVVPEVPQAAPQETTAPTPETQPAVQQTEAPTEETSGSTLPPNMLPIG